MGRTLNKEEIKPHLVSFYNDMLSMIEMNTKAIVRVDERLSYLNYGEEWIKKEKEFKESCLKSIKESEFFIDIIVNQVKKDYDMSIDTFIEKYKMK